VAKGNTMARETAPPAQFPWSTIGELATALGVHRNTVGNWVAEGAPPGPPYCELQWRIWIAAKGRKCGKVPEQGLLDMLVRAGIPDYRRLVEPTAPQASAPAVVPADDAKAAKAAADARRAAVEAEEAERRLDLDKGRLVPIDQVEQLVLGAVGVVVQLLDVLPALAASMPVAPAVQEQLRLAIEERLRAERDRLAAQTQQALQTWLDNWGTRNV
jgi:hypothetical protein